MRWRVVAVSREPSFTNMDAESLEGLGHGREDWSTAPGGLTSGARMRRR